jgi:acetyl-CoA acetyltransferase
VRFLWAAGRGTNEVRLLTELRIADIRLYVPEIRNPVTGKSMGEHTEEMAKDWNVGRREQDVARDGMPRRDTSLEKLARLAPVFDRTSGTGTFTTGNSSLLTDGAAFGRFPRERMNPNGGSVAIGHPFGATGARILSQAVKELAALPPGSRAVVGICADGGQGTVALLEG